MPTAVRRLIGQLSGGPSGVRVQSAARISAPISLLPARKSGAGFPSIRYRLILAL